MSGRAEDQLQVQASDTVTEPKLYPGSKKERRAPSKEPPAPKKDKTWQEMGKFLSYKGQTLEFFFRGAFAKALNRKVVTIRAMTMNNTICNPKIQDGHGRWLYTRDQIEDMVTLAEEEGVLYPQHAARFSERFSEEAHRILSRMP